MNIQEAYMHGFCKTAMENNIDPEKLLKSAGPMGLALKQLFRSSKKGIGRLMELLGGGNKKVLRDYNKVNSWLDAAANRSTRLGNTKGNLYYRAMQDKIDQAFRAGNGRRIELPGRRIKKTVWTPSETAGAAAKAAPTTVNPLTGQTEAIQQLAAGRAPAGLLPGATPQLTHVPQLTNKVPQLTNNVPQLPYKGGPVVPASGGALVPAGRGGAVAPYRGAAPAVAPSASPAAPTRGGAVDMVPQTVTEDTVRRFQATKAIADELRKVRLARYGTAGALGLGAGGFMLGRASKGDQA